jgi:excinuclease ABC subunit C
MILDDLKAFIRTCPLTPGIYIIKDRAGVPVYIGKARNLRSRLQSHFGPVVHPDFKEMLIRREAVRIDLVHTATEAEALLYEVSHIKHYQPKYNQLLKDDKTYPYLKITQEEFPRLLIVRGRASDGAKYYGPFTNVRLLRQALAMLRRLFPLRTCDPMPRKVCLMYHIGQCGGPCEGHTTSAAYAAEVQHLVNFLDGKRDALTRTLARRMKDAAANQEFELAKNYRDQMQALSAVAVGRTARRVTDRPQALQDLQRALNLSRFPSRIEAFDISNISGKNPVGSMVVMIDGIPTRSEYRRFKIKTVEGIDDYRMMREVVNRRYSRLLAEKKPLPDLVLIDGGRGHLAAAKEELDLLNLADLDVISIAKQYEYLYKPDRAIPYVLPPASTVLQMLRHLRDEAHRFAITFYRSLHRKDMQASELDPIPGIGPVKRARLLKAFRTVSGMRGLAAAEISERSGIDTRSAKAVEEYLKRE